MNGLLIVDKPSGMTSHDVVAVTRRLAQMRRVGHAGTLDPLATGVLVLLLGPATRLSQFVMGHDKRYRATLRLGEATNTYDAEGEVTARYPVRASRAEIEAALARFRGTLEQIPPMYSAVRVDGQRLYKLARQGKEVVRPPREVTVSRLELLEWAAPHLVLEVACSAGTYVRSLAHDLGQALGCGAHLTALVRTASGHFTLEQSHTLDDLGALAGQALLEDALLPPQAALYPHPTVTLDEAQESVVRHGQTLALDVPPAPLVAAVDAGGRMVAVMIPVEPGRWRPKVVFPA